MAILGFNLIISLITASVLQKFSMRMSFGRWLLCKRLRWYVQPSIDDLKKAVLDSFGELDGKTVKKRIKFENKKYYNINDDNFLVPKGIHIPLASCLVRPVDLLQLPYYIDYRWLLDFALATIFVFCASELFCTLFPIQSTKEFNLSVIWCIILLGFSLKSLCAVVALYFRNYWPQKTIADIDGSGERSLCFSFGAAFFLFTMVLFLFSDNILDLGLNAAYHEFSNRSTEFLLSQGIENIHHHTPILLYFFLSIFFGFLGGLLAFPCLRYAQMLCDALRYSQGSFLDKFLLYSSFLMPALCIGFWVKPIMQETLLRSDHPMYVRASFSKTGLDALRIWSVLIWCMLRLVVMRPCLQAYLNIAHRKVAELRRETGRINSSDLQKMVNRIFSYTCVVAIQYFSPVLLTLCLTLLLKILGRISLLKMIFPFWPASNSDSFNFVNIKLPKDIKIPLSTLATIFTPSVNRGLWSFALFWTLCQNFAITLVGFLYYTKLAG